MFKIRLGIPGVRDAWEELIEKIGNGTAGKNEKKRYEQIRKAMKHLSMDPRYPGLHTHEIRPLSMRYGQKVWESYLENRRSAAGRMFWVYGPGKEEITIIGIEPHPDRKSDAYDRIRLSSAGEIEDRKK